MKTNISVVQLCPKHSLSLKCKQLSQLHRKEWRSWLALYNNWQSSTNRVDFRLIVSLRTLVFDSPPRLFTNNSLKYNLDVRANWPIRGIPTSGAAPEPSWPQFSPPTTTFAFHFLSTRMMNNMALKILHGGFILLFFKVRRYLIVVWPICLPTMTSAYFKETLRK